MARGKGQGNCLKHGGREPLINKTENGFHYNWEDFEIIFPNLLLPNASSRSSKIGILKVKNNLR
jgi:hypothetical protein